MISTISANVRGRYVTCVFMLFTMWTVFIFGQVLNKYKGVACSIGKLKAIQFGANGAVMDNKREKFSISSQQIARVYKYHYSDLEKDDIKRIDEYYNEEIKEYKPFIADPTKGSWNESYYEKNPFGYYKL